ncbi:MAG: hypothetical protein NC043_06990 [Muribaculaceae bacterium]|nr:hypothetical protein [Muribaculaceae bacterium]
MILQSEQEKTDRRIAAMEALARCKEAESRHLQAGRLTAVRIDCHTVITASSPGIQTRFTGSKDSCIIKSGSA